MAIKLSNSYGIRDRDSNRAPTPRDSYNAAVQTQAGDYDRLMSLLTKQLGSPNNFSPLTRTQLEYETDPLISGQIGNLTNLARTGGYSDSELGNFRARAVSPIRAAYSNAMRNTNRATRLAGGYSPNAGAVQSKLAREQSEVMSNASTDAEADILDRVGQGRMNYNSQLTPLLARESDNRLRINQLNADSLREAEMFDAEQMSNDFQRRMAALNSMSSLYSSTPGLVSMFGQQALQERGQDISAKARPRSSRTAGRVRPSFG